MTNHLTTPLSPEVLRENQELDQRFCDGLGGDGLRKSIEDWFALCDAMRLVIDEIRHVPVGDAVFAVGTATYTLRGKDGSEQKLTERWTDVRRKVDGRWIYVMDHAHALPPTS